MGELRVRVIMTYEFNLQIGEFAMFEIDHVEVLAIGDDFVTRQKNFGLLSMKKYFHFSLWALAYYTYRISSKFVDIMLYCICKLPSKGLLLSLLIFTFATLTYTN